MSMMCCLAALSPPQILAFRARPELVGDFAEMSASDLLQSSLDAALARLPPAARDQYETRQRNLMAQNPAVPEQKTKRDAARAALAKLGPYEPMLDLGKAWNILNFVITGHPDAAAAPGDALLTGTDLGPDVGYGPARLQDVPETKAFRDFLANLDADRVVARMDFEKMSRLGVYPLSGVPDAADAQSWRIEVAAAFERLKAYVAHAADRGDGLLIWLS